ncbi:hypothetical protein V8305_002118 [Escherichia coli]
MYDKCHNSIMDKSGQKCNVAALFISYYLRVITSHYPELKVVIIKHYLRNIACGGAILNIVNLKKLLKTILNDT